MTVSFFSMLLYRHTKIELITDIDILLFLEGGIRGGVSYCATRMAENDDDPNEQTSLAYVDANNLVRI